MLAPQRTADDEHAIERVHVRDIHAEPWRARALAVGAEIRLPQPEIDVARAQAPHELLDEIELFQRLLGRGERADRGCAVLVADALKLPCDEFERDLPLDGFPY